MTDQTAVQTDVQIPPTTSESNADALSPRPEGGGHRSGPQGQPGGAIQSQAERGPRGADGCHRPHRTDAAQQVERIAAGVLSQPGDLFSLSGSELADYLTEDGDVDAEKVAADVAAVLAERPGLKRSSPAFDPTQGVGGGSPKTSPLWGSLLGQ